jgi:carbamoyl-phosphate synthase small subunit
VVFNTGMMGYTQSVTDCSYHGQILCQTYPLIGNYGISSAEFESSRPRISAYAVQEACATPSHYTSENGIGDWLADHSIPGISGIDTRELTKTLRNEGSMMGIIEVGKEKTDTAELLAELEKAQDPNERDLVSEVTIEKPVTYAGSGRRVVVVDCGTKTGIIRSLMARGAEVIMVPAHYGTDSIMDLGPDGVLFSNGPGDPKKVPYLIKTAAAIVESGMPTLGICLGNQILGLAMGCDTYKMKFGHRSQNQPVMESSTKKCHITSQNHGYTVSPDSVRDNDIEIAFVNVNDGTVEGISHRKLPCMGVQFHPEASPGPVETKFVFDRFMKMMEGSRAH